MKNKHLENLSKITEIFNRLGNFENFSKEDLDILKKDCNLLANQLSKEYDIQQDPNQTNE
jgi:predicted house-cleaning noncanonical NTP pyrophosphatase (MazG superfamily)